MWNTSQSCYAWRHLPYVITNSVICHSIQVNASRLNLDLPTPDEWKAEVVCVSFCFTCICLVNKGLCFFHSVKYVIFKMHWNAFGGRASPGPTGDLHRSPKHPGELRGGTTREGWDWNERSVREGVESGKGRAVEFWSPLQMFLSTTFSPIFVKTGINETKNKSRVQYLSHEIKAMTNRTLLFCRRSLLVTTKMKLQLHI